MVLFGGKIRRSKLPDNGQVQPQITERKLRLAQLAVYNQKIALLRRIVLLAEEVQRAEADAEVEKQGFKDKARAAYEKAYAMATAHNPPAAFSRPFARKKIGSTS